MAYRFYISDSLYAESHGKMMEKRFIDIIEPKEEIDGDAVLSHVMESGGLIYKE